MSVFISRPARLVAVCGTHAHIHPLVLQSLCVRAARGENLAVIVGDNRFDLYGLAHLVRAQGLHPTSVLSRIVLQRAFTCYQLVHGIATLHPSGFDALYVVGLLGMFYDRDIREMDAQRLVLTTLRELKQRAAHGLPILVTLSPPKQPGRETFVEFVRQHADVWWEPPPVAKQNVPHQCKLDFRRG